jgi:hypothetical protein
MTIITKGTKANGTANGAINGDAANLHRAEELDDVRLQHDHKSDMAPC